MNRKNAGNAAVVLLVIILILAAIVLGGYFLFKNYKNDSGSDISRSQAESVVSISKSSEKDDKDDKEDTDDKDDEDDEDDSDDEDKDDKDSDKDDKDDADSDKDDDADSDDSDEEIPANKIAWIDGKGTLQYNESYVLASFDTVTGLLGITPTLNTWEWGTYAGVDYFDYTEGEYTYSYIFVHDALVAICANKAGDLVDKYYNNAVKTYGEPYMTYTMEDGYIDQYAWKINDSLYFCVKNDYQYNGVCAQRYIFKGYNELLLSKYS